MDDVTKSKMAALGKMVLGAGRIASGVAMASGHGFIGGFCKNHHMMRSAVNLAKHSIVGGGRMFSEGKRDWDQAG